MKKASWLNKKVDLTHCRTVKALIKEFGLTTVCQEALCPNISECFSRGVVTFMILGNVCTRGCGFCKVKKGSSPSPLDESEPFRIKEAVKKLRLSYVIITSSTRDDLGDRGAHAFFRTVVELKTLKLVKAVEVLIPDFSLDKKAIELVLKAGPNVAGHNLETVPRLYPQVREGADYNRSLMVLKTIKQIKPGCNTKSGIMLGLGESEEEVISVLNDLRKVDVDFLSIGQYLAPSPDHYPVKECIHPDKFAYFEEKAYSLGFKHVKSAPYVRSSYLADTYLT